MGAETFSRHLEGFPRYSTLHRPDNHKILWIFRVDNFVQKAHTSPAAIYCGLQCSTAQDIVWLRESARVAVSRAFCTYPTTDRYCALAYDVAQISQSDGLFCVLPLNAPSSQRFPRMCKICTKMNEKITIILCNFLRDA